MNVPQYMYCVYLQFRLRFKIKCDAIIHTEKSHENPVMHSPLCAKSVRPKPRLVQEDPNEIFPIPDNISWRKISKNLDFYRLSIEKQELSNESKDDQVIIIYLFN